MLEDDHLGEFLDESERSWTAFIILNGPSIQAHRRLSNLALVVIG